MSEQVRVEIVPHMAPTDPEVRARINETVHPDLQMSAVERDGWAARINGAEFPLVTYGMEYVDGRVLVSLVVEADSVQVGGPLTSTTPPQQRPAEEKSPVSTWGAGKVDPRESIPGWKPEAVEVHPSPTVEYDPGDGDRIIGTVREFIKRNGRAAGVLA